MARQLLTGYRFSPRKGQVVLNTSPAPLDKILSIYDVTLGQALYLRVDFPYTQVNADTITLAYVPAGARPSDELQIWYDPDYVPAADGTPSERLTTLEAAVSVLEAAPGAPVTSVENRTGNVDVVLADIAGLQTALDGKASKPYRLFHVDDYGADPTGVASSNAALAAAKTALGTDPGAIMFGVGVYKLTAPCPSRFYEKQSVKGVGIGATTINYTGTGILFEAYDNRAWGAGGPGRGEFWGPYTIDGTGCGVGSIGLKVGDLTAVSGRLRVMNFSNTSCIGVLFKNDYTWTERLDFQIYSNYNTQGVKFERGAGTGTNSFGYARLWLEVACNAGQDGVVFKNNCTLYSSDLTMVGNFNVGVGNTSTALLIGENGSADQSTITSSRISIMIETDGGTGVGHKDVVINGTAGQLQGQGVLKFLAGNGVGFASGAARAKMAFTGQISGSSGLGASTFWQGSRTLGLVTTSYQGALVDTTNNILYLTTGGNTLFGQFGSGARTLAFGASADITTLTSTGQVATYDIFLQQPASGVATFTWPASVTWLDGFPARTSSVVNAVDHIRIVTRDFVTFYAQHVNKRAVTRTVTNLTISLTLGANEATEYVTLIGASGAPTLPTAVANNSKYIFKNIDASAHNIATTSSQTIDGVAAPLSLAAAGIIHLISDGANWRSC